MGRPKNKPKVPEITVSRLVWANIRKIQYLQGMTDESLASLIGCTERTLLNWDKSPEKITLNTLQLFCTGAGVQISNLFE